MANNTTAERVFQLGFLLEYVNIFHVVCAPLTIMLNGLVLFIAIRKVDFSVRLNQYIVVSITFADCVFGVVYVATKHFVLWFPRSICQMDYIITWIVQFASILSLLLLNCDKVIGLRFPLHYQRIVTTKRVQCLTGAIWALAIVYGIGSFLGPFAGFYSAKIRTLGAIINSDCMAFVQPVYYLTTILSFYVTPLLLSLFMSVYIFYIAQHSAENLPGISEREKQQLHSSEQTVLKRVLFVFSSTTLTALTCLPYRVVYCVVQLCQLICGQGGGTNRCVNCYPYPVFVMSHAFMFLVPLGCVINPVVTIATQHVYRKNVKKILSSMWFNFCHLCTLLNWKLPFLNAGYASYGSSEYTLCSTLSPRPPSRPMRGIDPKPVSLNGSAKVSPTGIPSDKLHSKDDCSHDQEECVLKFTLEEDKIEDIDWIEL